MKKPKMTLFDYGQTLINETTFNANPVKKYKILIRLIIGLFICYGLYSASVIRDKTRFESKWDDEFYQEFVMRYTTIQNSDIECIEKISKGQSLSYEEMFTITMKPPIDIQISINKLEGFYYEYYSRKVGANIYSNIYAFLNHSSVRKEDFKKIVDNRYMIKKERMEYYDNYYIKPKAIAINKVIKEFNAVHKLYLDGLSTKKNKHFVRDGVWKELFLKMDDTLKKIDLDYDFGKHAPKELRLRDIDTMGLPREVSDVNMTYTDVYYPRKFKILDSETGVYIYFYTSGCRDKLEIVKIKKMRKTIHFIIDEGSEPVYNGNPGVYNIMLIRGLKPGEAKQYKYRLTNTRGEEYTNLDKAE